MICLEHNIVAFLKYIMTKVLFNKIHNVQRHLIARLIQRNIKRLVIDKPTISFSFDDFPQTAIKNGAARLLYYKLRGTFYVSMGILNQVSAVGKITGIEGVEGIIDSGHEIGCHTLDHKDAWITKPDEYKSAIEQNILQLHKHFGKSVSFTSFAYPKGSVTISAKKLVQKHFVCARGINPGIMVNSCDTNLLPSIPLISSENSLNYFKKCIDTVVNSKGWMIFFTHDICTKPSAFGCSIDIFEKVIEYISKKNVNVLPVREAFDKFTKLAQM
jgi:peptidoglycan/xylan/chitin deacetylase (PgdA/CDA1 family)